MIVYYTTAPTDGPAFVRNILHTRYGIANAQFARGEHGKPRLLNAPLHFSLSHTRGRTFVAVADEPVGLDAEWRGRSLPRAYLARLTPAEREEDFFRLWTAKEAYIKYLGGTLADMLPSLRFEGGTLFGHGAPLPVHIAFFEAENATLALCTASPQHIQLVHG